MLLYLVLGVNRNIIALFSIKIDPFVDLSHLLPPFATHQGSHLEQRTSVVILNHAPICHPEPQAKDLVVDRLSKLRDSSLRSE